VVAANQAKSRAVLSHKPHGVRIEPTPPNPESRGQWTPDSTRWSQPSDTPEHAILHKSGRLPSFRLKSRANCEIIHDEVEGYRGFLRVHVRWLFAQVHLIPSDADRRETTGVIRCLASPPAAPRFLLWTGIRNLSWLRQASGSAQARHRHAAYRINRGTGIRASLLARLFSAMRRHPIVSCPSALTVQAGRAKFHRTPGKKTADTPPRSRLELWVRPSERSLPST